MKTKYILLFLMLASQTIISQVQTGKASFYGDKYDGRKTANGEIFRQSKMTAAHKTLPFDTKVKVTNLANNKSIVVRVNDRGPFVPGRIIDVSKAAARKLDFVGAGVTDVVVRVLKPNSDPTTENEEPTNVDLFVESEFFQLETKQISPEGFAVQVGSFENSENLIRFSDRLESTYRENVTVQIRRVEDSKIYAVLIGSFNERKKAERFRDKVTRKYPGSFIVDFSEIVTK